jgi:predicted component of type VI protein secretion system
MKFSLVVGQGAHKGRNIPVSGPQFLIGRDSKCQLRPASQTISKRHCELLIRDEQCFVRDLNSTNGTFVNDQQVTGEQELHDGDALKVGPLDFGIRIEIQAEKPTAVERDTQAPEAATAAAVPTAEVADNKPEVLDEDAVGSMLLELTGAEQAADQDSALEGSTIMDMLKSPADEPQQAKPAPYRPASQKPASGANTSSAAKAILEKYRRRPRS